MKTSRPLFPLLIFLLFAFKPAAAAPWKSILDDLRRNVAGGRRATPRVQESAASGVLSRLLPSHVSSFRFRVVSEDVSGGSSFFRLSDVENSGPNGPKIMIQGTSGVDLSFGLHWYLKYWCGVHISWDKTGGVQLISIPPPDSLPQVGDSALQVERPVPLNYYQNVVTSSYSFAWWDWQRWEKEIDWMALHGINLPLAFTGQEAIWQKVFKAFNVSDDNLDGFFGGPAFLAWARMGNLHGWGGPLTQNWLDEQLMLQKHILSRMIDLGMTPVLPAFSGNVPAVLQRLFPNASITKLGNWNSIDSDTRWCCNSLLDPSDSLFIDIGKAFIQQQIKEYGHVTNIYSCDTFNENIPPTDDPKYIATLGSSVYEAMSKGDSGAIWLMQGWLFSSDATFWKPPQMQALLYSVPIGKMLVLDLFADVKPIWNKSSHFYGVPYVWCMLHNFGGNIEMYGILDKISSGPIDARTSYNSTMVGVGMCMEGIEHNPIVYDLMSEMAFRKNSFSVMEWVKLYSFRRYGKHVPEMEKAWMILYRTIYNCTDGIEDHNKDYIVKFPDENPGLIGNVISNRRNLHNGEGNHRAYLSEISSVLPQPHLWYSTKEVIEALKLFIDAGHILQGSPTYSYDLVDLSRQALSKYANKIYLRTLSAYHRNDSKSLHLYSNKFLDLIKDIDALLASEPGFLLGTWLEKAKAHAKTPNERTQYEWNARTQITMWFDNTNTNQSILHDYANKFWSGLLKDYYYPRASMYFDYLSRSLRDNTSFLMEDWRKNWISYSSKWQSSEELYAVRASGDALYLAKSLFKKYLS